MNSIFFDYVILGRISREAWLSAPSMKWCILILFWYDTLDYFVEDSDKADTKLPAHNLYTVHRLGSKGVYPTRRIDRYSHLRLSATN